MTATDRTCVLPGRHYPRPLVSEWHHLVPRAWQRFWHPPDITPVIDPVYGPVWITDGAWLCRTGHANVHQGGLVPLMRQTRPTANRGEVAMARRGLDLWTGHGGSLADLRHAGLETAISAFGWVAGCALAVGTAAWFRTLRRVIRAG